MNILVTCLDDIMKIGRLIYFIPRFRGMIEPRSMILVLHVSDLNPMRLCIRSAGLRIGNKGVRMALCVCVYEPTMCSCVHCSLSLGKVLLDTWQVLAMLINQIIITAPEFWTKNPSYTEKVDVRKRKEELGKAADHFMWPGLCMWSHLLGNPDMEWVRLSISR